MPGIVTLPLIQLTAQVCWADLGNGETPEQAGTGMPLKHALIITKANRLSG